MTLGESAVIIIDLALIDSKSDIENGFPETVSISVNPLALLLTT